jgi:hypothetical protein
MVEVTGQKEALSVFTVAYLSDRYVDGTDLEAQRMTLNECILK